MRTRTLTTFKSVAQCLWCLQTSTLRIATRNIQHLPECKSWNVGFSPIRIIKRRIEK